MSFAIVSACAIHTFTTARRIEKGAVLMHAFSVGGRCEAALLQLQLTRHGSGDAGRTRRAFLVCRLPHYISDIGFAWTETRHNTSVLLCTRHRRLCARRSTPVPRVPGPTPPSPPARRRHAAAAANDEILDVNLHPRDHSSLFTTNSNAKADGRPERESESGSERSSESNSDDEDEGESGAEHDSGSGHESAQEELAT